MLPPDRTVLSYKVLKDALTAVATVLEEAKVDPGEVGAENSGSRSILRSVASRAGSRPGEHLGHGDVRSGLAGSRAGRDGRFGEEPPGAGDRPAGRAGGPGGLVGVGGPDQLGYAGGGRELGIPDGEVERAWRVMASASDLVWQYLEDSLQPWLLVFDNADDPAELDPVSGNVADGRGWLRPHTGNGMVVVTSRDRSEATWGTWCQVHPVSPLGAEDGAAMLTEYLGLDRGTYDQARALSAELGGLPLALRKAADHIKSSSTRAFTGGPSIRNMVDYQAAVKRRFEAAAGAPHWTTRWAWKKSRRSWDCPWTCSPDAG